MPEDVLETTQASDAVNIDKQPKNSNGLIVFLIVLICVLLIGGSFLFYYLNGQISDLERTLSDEQQVTTEQVTVAETAAPATIEDKQDSANDVKNLKAIDYYNQRYGFGLTLPASWENYSVTVKSTNWSNRIIATSLYFGFPEQADGLFAITVFTKDQWDKLSGLSPAERGAAYLGENSMYVFAWARSQFSANKEMEIKALEIENIVNSFYTDAK
ncbi:MAG: hypothetical protein ACOZBH_05635 [Patescibacteria group bacterium]